MLQVINKNRKNLTKYSKDFLFHGLPAVFYKNNFLIFSPYNKKMIKASEKELNDKLFKNYLRKEGYFNESKKHYQKDTAKLTLILTSDCNLRCKYCYASCGQTKRYMSKSFALRAVDEVIKSKTEKIIVSFFGGEPTLCVPLIKEVVKFIEQKNIEYEFHLSTNGIAIADDAIDFFVKNKFVIGVSIDGTPSFQNKLRVSPDNKPTAPLVETTIKKLVTRKAHFTVRPTITSFNVGIMSKMVDYFVSLGIKFIHFELVDIYGRALNNKIKFPISKDYIGNFKKVFKKAQKHGVNIINSNFINLLSPSDYYCSSCRGETFIFTPDEYITTCYEIQEGKHKFQEFVIGKYNREKNIFIYDKNKIKNLKNITTDSYAKCKNCFARYICGSGCPLKNFRFKKSFEYIDPHLCIIKKNIIRESIISVYNSSLKKEVPVVFGINAYENIT